MADGTMPRKFEKPTGRISLRIPPQLHGEIAQAAQWLGLDITALINLMLHEITPKYLEQGAQAVVKRLDAATKAIAADSGRRLMPGQLPAIVMMHVVDGLTASQIAESTRWDVSRVENILRDHQDLVEAVRRIHGEDPTAFDDDPKPKQETAKETVERYAQRHRERSEQLKSRLEHLEQQRQKIERQSQELAQSKPTKEPTTDATKKPKKGTR